MQEEALALYVPFSCELIVFNMSYVELVDLSSPWWRIHKKQADYMMYTDRYESRSNVIYEAKFYRNYVIKQDRLVANSDYFTFVAQHYRGIVTQEFYPAMYFVYQPFPAAYELFLADERKSASPKSKWDFDET